MPKLGILFCAYNNETTIVKSLEPWLERQDCVVSVCSSPFKEYKDLNQPKDWTQDILNTTKGIHYLWQNNTFEYDEAQVRNKALLPLLESQCEYIWLVDGDEIYTTEQIDNIINFVNRDEFTTWYSINFKNYIFDEESYCLGFCPPRIFRVKSAFKKLNSLYFDNDFYYKDDNGDLTNYKSLSSKSIPQSVALIRHITWLSNETSRLKVEYQMKHFGGLCSYKWNYDSNKLEFNDEFYQKTGQSKPQIFYDSEKSV